MSVNSNAIEIALPSGLFARIRPVRFVDGLIANQRARDAETVYAAAPGDDRAGIPLYVAALIARCVLFDDAAFTIEQVLDLDARDSGALLNAMGPFLTGPIR